MFEIKAREIVGLAQRISKIFELSEGINWKFGSTVQPTLSINEFIAEPTERVLAQKTGEIHGHIDLNLALKVPDGEEYEIIEAWGDSVAGNTYCLVLYKTFTNPDYNTGLLNGELMPVSIAQSASAQIEIIPDWDRVIPGGWSVQAVKTSGAAEINFWWNVLYKKRQILTVPQ